MKKICPKCKVPLELTTENFARDRNSKDGFKWRCKKCIREYFQQRYVALKAKKGKNACAVCGRDRGPNHARCNSCLNKPVPSEELPITTSDLESVSRQQFSDISRHGFTGGFN